jgi:transcription antitermination factor NusG
MCPVSDGAKLCVSFDAPPSNGSSSTGSPYWEPIPLVVSLPVPEVHWYAVYTCAQHEKAVARQFELRSIESFLPLYYKRSRWKDRWTHLELPLFPGYVFVRIPLESKLRVLQVPGVVRLVGFGGQPVRLNALEIETIQNGLRTNLFAQPHSFLTIGRRVWVRSGPFRGLRGILLKRKNGCRLVLSLELIQRSIVVDVDASDIEAA